MDREKAPGAEEARPDIAAAIVRRRFAPQSTPAPGEAGEVEERYKRVTLDEVTELLDGPGVELVEASVAKPTNAPHFDITIRRPRPTPTPGEAPEAPPGAETVRAAPVTEAMVEDVVENILDRSIQMLMAAGWRRRAADVTTAEGTNGVRAVLRAVIAAFATRGPA